MALTEDAIKVRDALVKKGLETPFSNNGIPGSEKKAMIASHISEIMTILGLDITDDSLVARRNV